MSRCEHLPLGGEPNRVRFASGADAAGALVAARRELLLRLTDMVPGAAWRVCGARSAVDWLMSCGVAQSEARGLARTAQLASRHPQLRSALASGQLSASRCDVLTSAATHERADHLAASLDTLLDLDRRTRSDDDFATAVRFWCDRVDEVVAPRHEPAHHLHLAPSLFGSGRIWGELTPASFATVAAALDAFMQDPDPAHAPHQRTLVERRADALDDLAHFALTHDPDDADDPDDPDDDICHADIFDGTTPVDELDLALSTDEGTHHLDLLRHRLRATELERRRRAHRQVRRRSGATVNVRIDLRTLAGRPIDDDLLGLDLATDRWALARSAAERLLCDSGLVATLFAGPAQVLDANARTERFTLAQRRALAMRDRHCAFPTCRRPSSHCDAHHLHPTSEGGESRISNAALVCRHHHRLIHEHGWRLEQAGDRWLATDRHGSVFADPP